MKFAIRNIVSCCKALHVYIMVRTVVYKDCCFIVLAVYCTYFGLVNYQQC